MKLNILNLLLLLNFCFCFSQNSDVKLELIESNKTLYTSFIKFYNDSIRLESKDEWGESFYYNIDQINGVHYFDYNEDGIEDVLVEFSTSPSDSWSSYSVVSAMFRNENSNYIIEAFFYSNNLKFKKYSKPFFFYSGVNDNHSDKLRKYILEVNQFMKK